MSKQWEICQISGVIHHYIVMYVMFQFEGMEELKSKAQTMITPLRAKVLRLAKKCQTKVRVQLEA